MKALYSILLIIIFTSSAIADTIYLRNGQSFNGNLVSVKANKIVVEYGHGSNTAEVDFDTSIIGRVEDEIGQVIFENGVFVSPYLERQEGAEITQKDSEELAHWNSGALSRGSFLLGGLISFSSFGGDVHEGAYAVGNDNRYNLASVTPSVSYFLKDNIAVGMDVMYTREWFADQSRDQFAFIPKLTYTIPMDGDLRPYIGGGIGLLRWQFNEERQYSDIGMTAKAGFGLFYFMNEHYATTMELAYRWDRFSADQASYPITGNTILFSIGMTGFLY
jgi:hypothetical protein